MKDTTFANCMLCSNSVISTRCCFLDIIRKNASLRMTVEGIPKREGCWKKVCSPDVVAVLVLVRSRTTICNETWKNTSKPSNKIINMATNIFC